MKKNLILLVILLSLLSLSACNTKTTTKNGVPEAQIRADLLYEGIDLANTADSVTYDISHEINTDTHTDTASVIMRGTSAFGVKTYTFTMHYQYYASDDLWELIGFDKASCRFKGNPVSFHGHWTIREYEREYALWIYEFDGSCANVSFIEYSGDDVKYIFDGLAALELREFEDSSYYAFIDSDTQLRFVSLDIDGASYKRRPMEYLS